MSKKNSKTKSKLPAFDKYDLYLESVQSPEADVEFFADAYKEIRKKNARVLREDFCGTFAIACEWAKTNPKNIGIGVDLDPEPIAYGMTRHHSKLTADEQKRVRIYNDNVLTANTPKSDVVVAVNFSYYLFKSRLLLKSYFRKCYQNLADDGVLLADCFGGPLCMEPNEDEKNMGKFYYYWDQDSYDPITHEAMFYIHFKRKGEKNRREKVFTYDWRMWTIPELREILMEVGFKKTYVYWEGTKKNGEGDGNFKRKEHITEDSGAWVAYVAGVK